MEQFDQLCQSLVGEGTPDLASPIGLRTLLEAGGHFDHPLGQKLGELLSAVMSTRWHTRHIARMEFVLVSTVRDLVVAMAAVGAVHNVACH